jgi:hypothetical protein
VIAVIEREHSVVWGYGITAVEAMQDAERWIASWKLAMTERGKQAVVGALEYARLDPKADFKHCDGEGLWRWVLDKVPVQGDLFR